MVVNLFEGLQRPANGTAISLKFDTSHMDNFLEKLLHGAWDRAAGPHAHRDRSTRANKRPPSRTCTTRCLPITPILQSQRTCPPSLRSCQGDRRRSAEAQRRQQEAKRRGSRPWLVRMHAMKGKPVLCEKKYQLKAAAGFANCQNRRPDHILRSVSPSSCRCRLCALR